jgi:hypothetical protein
MRGLVLVAALVVFTGCGSSEKKPAATDAPPNDAFGVAQACLGLKEKLASFTPVANATIAVGRIQNRTPRRMDMTVLEDKLRATLTESGKFTVLASPSDAAPTYVLGGNVSETVMKNDTTSVRATTYSLQLIEKAREAIVLTAIKEVRETRQ